MALAFVLRFQDYCAENDVEAVRCGTQTSTKIQGEQPDLDPTGLGFVAVPQIEAGTMTGTRIKSEQPDADRNSSANAIPTVANDLLMGTRTVTAVRAEADDEDPRKCQLQAIPRCSSY